MFKELKSAILFLTFAVFGNKQKRIFKHDCSSAPPDNISCHNTYIKNDLPTADEMEFPEKSIFFVETSCKGGLDSRQACSVESAARVHPNWQVNVLFAGPVPDKCHEHPSFLALKRYKNINIFRIHTLELAKDTSLENLLELNPLECSEWPVTHASDILRYLVLYKWSGVYLDLDIIVLKPFDGLAKNWAAKEMADEEHLGVGCGALAFSSDYLGREVAASAFDFLTADFRGWIRNYNGPDVMYRTLRRLCSTNDPERMSVQKCHGFVIYDARLFNPVHYYDARKLFNEGQLYLGSAYTCHVWSSSMSQNMTVHRRSPYAKLAATHCPQVFNLYGSLFGSA